MTGKIVNHVPRLLKEKGFNKFEDAATELMYGIRVARQTAEEWAKEGNLPRAIYLDSTLPKLCNYFNCGVGEILEYVEEE